MALMFQMIFIQSVECKSFGLAMIHANVLMLYG